MIGIVSVIMVTAEMRPWPKFASYFLGLFFLKMRCSRTRTIRTPMTKPFPMIGLRVMGNNWRNDPGRKAIIVPASMGIPMARVF